MTRPRIQLENDRVCTVRANLSRPRCFFFFFCKFFFFFARAHGAVSGINYKTTRIHAEKVIPSSKNMQMIYLYVYLGFSLLVLFHIFVPPRFYTTMLLFRFPIIFTDIDVRSMTSWLVFFFYLQCTRKAG